MKLPQLNEYLQTLATAGAIAGLVLVAYEVRQSNNFAISEAASRNYSNGLNRQLSLLDAQVAETLAKAMTKKASELTLTEKIDLNLYLSSWVLDWEHKINTVWLLGIDVKEGIANLQEIASDAALSTFGTAYARAWLEVNRAAIEPDLLKAIDRGLENAPLGASQDYFQRIDDIAASLEKG